MNMMKNYIAMHLICSVKRALVGSRIECCGHNPAHTQQVCAESMVSVP